MAFVYILKSAQSPKTYVGSTMDLRKRVEEHNKGLSTFSSRYKPWDLVYKEEYENIQEARTREKYLKSAAGRRWIKKQNLIS